MMSGQFHTLPMSDIVIIVIVICAPPRVGEVQFGNLETSLFSQTGWGSLDCFCLCFCLFLFSLLYVFVFVIVHMLLLL